jgi:hypothetical protein
MEEGLAHALFFQARSFSSKAEERLVLCEEDESGIGAIGGIAFYIEKKIDSKSL